MCQEIMAEDSDLWGLYLSCPYHHVVSSLVSGMKNAVIMMFLVLSLMKQNVGKLENPRNNWLDSCHLFFSVPSNTTGICFSHCSYKTLKKTFHRRLAKSVSWAQRTKIALGWEKLRKLKPSSMRCNLPSKKKKTWAMKKTLLTFHWILVG